MRRLLMLLVVLLCAFAWVLSSSCKKEVLKETPEEGEEQPEGTGPKPPPMPGK
ncbi:MAG: hypothetical protein JXR96_09470 [Deltaproteobacteria bacterium]|nr:hypothetical protein [Deltaproteobacteria bacterium]